MDGAAGALAVDFVACKVCGYAWVRAGLAPAQRWHAARLLLWLAVSDPGMDPVTAAAWRAMAGRHRRRAIRQAMWARVRTALRH